MQPNKSRIRKIKTVRCHKCGNDWPRVSSAPQPGRTGVYVANSVGFWTRDVTGYTRPHPERPLGPDNIQRTLYGEWYFVGPCCEHDYSGPDYIDEDWPPKESDEEFFDHDGIDDDWPPEEGWDKLLQDEAWADWIGDDEPDGSEEMAA